MGIWGVMQLTDALIQTAGQVVVPLQAVDGSLYPSAPTLLSGPEL